MDENHHREVSAVVTAEPPETTRDGVLALMANKQRVGRFKTLVQSGTEASPPGCHQQRTETEWAAELAWDTISTVVK